MSFYIRKSLRAGPFRFNLSKSGIGVSAGVTGLRVGSGPRGNYVHMGRKGVYYRSTLPSSTQKAKKDQPANDSAPRTYTAQGVVMEEVESGDVLRMQDSSSADLLAELDKKRKRPPLFPIAGIALIILLIILASVGLPLWAFLLIVLIGIAVLVPVYLLDQIHKSVILFYELEEGAEGAFQRLHDGFAEIAKSQKSWHIEAKGQVRDLQTRKRQAGASQLVKRKAVKLTSKSPPFVKTNVSVPAIPVGRQTIYLMPDRILVYDRRGVGAVPYSEIELDVETIRFIETESVPQDTEVVDHTWRYVNKSGGPDRRFKDNKRLPIVVYSDLYFTSPSGLNEKIEVSKPKVGSALAACFGELAKQTRETKAEPG